MRHDPTGMQKEHFACCSFSFGIPITSCWYGVLIAMKFRLKMFLLCTSVLTAVLLLCSLRFGDTVEWRATKKCLHQVQAQSAPQMSIGLCLQVNLILSCTNLQVKITEVNVVIVIFVKNFHQVNTNVNLLIFPFLRHSEKLWGKMDTEELN